MTHGNRFHNFDGLRFFAAVLVVLGHIEMMKEKFNLPSFYHNNFFVNAGPLAVTFFFVLSGFLITYLLIIEQQKKGEESKRINLLQFYKNRILRIWPLYYTLILLVYLIFPQIPLLQYPGYGNDYINNEFKPFALYLSFLPNLSYYLYGNVLYIGQMWSLGVEEFFYIFFPLGLYFVAYKNSLKYFLLLVICSIILTALSKFWCNASDTNLPLACIYISRYRIYSFAFGAIAAFYYLRLNNNSFIATHIKTFRTAGYISFFSMTAIILLGITFGTYTQPIFSLLFVAVIFLISVSGIKIKLLNNPALIYLGKISYGIYMLHPLATVICIKLLYFNTGNSILTAILFSVIVIGVTIILSVISYTFIEKPFLNLRKSKKGPPGG